MPKIPLKDFIAMNEVDKKLESIHEKILDILPENLSISSVNYEGPELVVYTPDPKKFAESGDIVRTLASSLQKRITIRPDLDSLLPPKQTEEIIHKIKPKEANVTSLDFHEDTGEVLIEATRPGMVIGRHGSTMREITQQIGWTPDVVRTPPIDSNVVSNVRNFLKQQRKERRSILERIGRHIHRPKKSSDKWVGLTTLG